VQTVEDEGSPTGAGATVAPPRFGPWRREVAAFLELFALCGVAIAQPTLDIFQRNADFLLSRRTTVTEAVLFAIVLIVVPALVLWTVEVLVGLVAPAARRVVHAALAALLAGIIVVELLKRATGLGPTVLVVAGVVLGAVAGVLLYRWAWVRTWLRYLAFAPPLFAVIFVFFSAVTPVIFVSDPEPAAVDVERPTRVVMVVLDELPTASLLDGNGNIDGDLYPNLAALAQTGTWYRNHGTVSPRTVAAVPAILTGRRPDDAPVPIASEYPENLFTLLGRSYDMNVHESATRLCTADACGSSQAAGANDGFGGLLREGVDQWRSFASPNRTSRQDALLHESPHTADAVAAADDFVRSLRPSDGPELDFVHILLPHTPWHYLGAGQDYVALAGQGIRTGTWRDPWNAEFGRARHLLQVQTADWVVGQIVAKLRAIGEYDDSLIVVTADHGVAFTPGSPSRGVSSVNYPQIVWTPLLVKAPGQVNGVVDDRFAESVDILPTIASELGVRIPWRVDGHALTGAPRPERPRRVEDWALSQMRPVGDRPYVVVDGPAGFARVKQSRATFPIGDPDLRPYRVGGYGSLVGQPIAPLERRGAAAPAATVADAAAYRDVRPDAKRIPWAAVHGTVDVPPGTWVAVGVNGTVAAVSQTVGAKGTRKSEYAGLLPPKLVRRGANDVRVYVVEGTPAAPRLQATRAGS
jgi:hypothetical protein